MVESVTSPPGVPATRKVEPGSVADRAKLGLALLLGFVGDAVMLAVGAAVSIVHV